MIEHMQLSGCKDYVNSRCKEGHKTPPPATDCFVAFGSSSWWLGCLSNKMVKLHYSATAGLLVMHSIVTAGTSECPTSLCA